MKNILWHYSNKTVGRVMLGSEHLGHFFKGFKAKVYFAVYNTLKDESTRISGDLLGHTVWSRTKGEKADSKKIYTFFLPSPH